MHAYCQRQHAWRGGMTMTCRWRLPVAWEDLWRLPVVQKGLWKSRGWGDTWEVLGMAGDLGIWESPGPVGQESDLANTCLWQEEVKHDT